MTMTETTPTPTPTPVERVFYAPQLSVPLTDLFQMEEIFVGVGQAQAWVDQSGSEVLKEKGLEVVTNLLGASSEERRNLGLLTLERAILAQAAWIQLFDLMAPCGRIDQLKKLIAAVRDKDASVEEHFAARVAVLEAFAEYSTRRHEADELIDQIIDLASEEPFIVSARTGSVTGNRGQSMGIYPWMVEALDKVLAGHGYREAVKTLRLTAERLDLLSRIFFGETTSNGGGKSKGGRSAKKAAKAEADRQLRLQMRGAQGQKPQRGKRS